MNNNFLHRIFLSSNTHDNNAHLADANAHNDADANAHNDANANAHNDANADADNNNDDTNIISKTMLVHNDTVSLCEMNHLGDSDVVDNGDGNESHVDNNSDEFKNCNDNNDDLVDVGNADNDSNCTTSLSLCVGLNNHTSSSQRGISLKRFHRKTENFKNMKITVGNVIGPFCDDPSVASLVHIDASMKKLQNRFFSMKNTLPSSHLPEVKRKGSLPLLPGILIY